MTRTMTGRPLTSGPLAWCVTEQGSRRIEGHRCGTCGGEMLGVGAGSHPQGSPDERSEGSKPSTATS